MVHVTRTKSVFKDLKVHLQSIYNLWFQTFKFNDKDGFLIENLDKSANINVLRKIIDQYVICSSRSKLPFRLMDHYQFNDATII